VVSKIDRFLYAFEMLTKKRGGFYSMRGKGTILFKYSALIILFVFGVITIIGSSGDDDKKSTPTSDIAGEWDFTYGWDNLPGISQPQRFVFTQDGKNVTFTGSFVTPDNVVYPCEGEGTVKGDELEITAWNDDVNINLTVIFYTGLIDNLDTRIVGMIEDDISWEATWGIDNNGSGIWSAEKCSG